MPGTKSKRIILHCAIILLIVIAVILSLCWNNAPSEGVLKLPRGPGTPMVSVGQVHGLIVAADGSLWSWGSDFFGWPVLGLPRVHQTPRLVRIGSDTNWIGVSAADEHNLALKSDGTVWAWGENLEGQLGYGSSTGSTNMPAPAILGHGWTQVAADSYSSFALKKDGTLWAWGMNWAGELGLGFTNRGVRIAAQVGTATNWVKVWGGGLATVAMQSDGSLWYWGENPNPAFAQGSNQIVVPTRVSPDTNWTSVGFGTEDTVFALKSDGSLWAWGRQAHVYTGETNLALDAVPLRVGTNTDWQSISASGNWWCQGLTKKDGSTCLMDASEGKPNGPRPPWKPLKFTRINFPTNYAAFIAGAAHDSAPGVHAPVGVVIMPNGEVWTWGMALGEAHLLPFQTLVQKIGKLFHRDITFADPKSPIHDIPWQLPHDEPGESGPTKH